jgi:hypothetical protein
MNTSPFFQTPVNLMSHSFQRTIDSLIILSLVTCVVTILYLDVWEDPEFDLGLYTHFSLGICMILSLFYKSSHSKGVKIWIFVLQFPWILVLVSTVSWYLWTTHPPSRKQMKETVKNNENHETWMSTLLILSPIGLVCFLALVVKNTESNLGLHAHFSLAICMILSLFYRSSHSKGVKILIFILQLPWIFIFVDTVSWYLWTTNRPTLMMTSKILSKML